MPDVPPKSDGLSAVDLAKLFMVSTKEQFDLAMEQLRERGWFCEVHGDVGREVDGLKRCRAKDDDEVCGLVCQNTGRLIYDGPNRPRMLSICADVSAVLPQVMAAHGLKGPTKVENHAHLTVFNFPPEVWAALPESAREAIEAQRLKAIEYRG